MDYREADKLVKQLVAGFDSLRQEYQNVFDDHRRLEGKLEDARQQHADLLVSTNTASITGTTPPESPVLWHRRFHEQYTPEDALEALAESQDEVRIAACSAIRLGDEAARELRDGMPSGTPNGVAIHTGPSADSIMPAIPESLLEQDFTVAGTPSKLGCPFASMAGKKLSNHAANIVSRYTRGSGTGGPPSTPLNSGSLVRINGRENMRGGLDGARGRIASGLADPIKPEICGLSSHSVEAQSQEHAIEDQPAYTAEAGICPIRFLDQHSPEDVASYFEKHKHELPRSHEACVKRYQSNEQSIRELDAKYGNLVSMIQGLGAKHQPMLPKEPDDEITAEDARGAERVKTWATNVSAQAQDGTIEDEETKEQDQAGEEQDDERLRRFERPLRDVHVGESPSRPWGIPVPARFQSTPSQVSSKAAEVVPPPLPPPVLDPRKETQTDKQGARCPFGVTKPVAPAATADRSRAPDGLLDRRYDTKIPAPVEQTMQEPSLVAQAAAEKSEPNVHVIEEETGRVAKDRPQIVFSGPVFIGYSAEDAARILRESGLGEKG